MWKTETVEVTGGIIFLTYIFDVSFSRVALEPLGYPYDGYAATSPFKGGLVFAERGGVIFFTFIFNLPFTLVALMPRGHFLLSVVTKESKNTLWDKESRSPFAEVLSFCLIRH